MGSEPKVLNIFKRYELKYLLDDAQYSALMRAMEEKMRGDEYGMSDICNIYFDTPDYRLIRRSLEKPAYKEKLRLRSYGTPSEDSRVFLELKKKYESIVYKRREAMSYREALGFIESPMPYSQITREIAYFMDFYPEIAPAVFISYKREAYYGISDPELRITFDRDILWRNTETELSRGIYGNAILPDGRRLMEIKTGGAMPLWLASVLSEEKIRQTSFSKYGRAYEAIAGASSPCKRFYQIPATITKITNQEKTTSKGDKIYA